MASTNQILKRIFESKLGQPIEGYAGSTNQLVFNIVAFDTHALSPFDHGSSTHDLLEVLAKGGKTPDPEPSGDGGIK